MSITAVAYAQGHTLSEFAGTDRERRLPGTPPRVPRIPRDLAAAGFGSYGATSSDVARALENLKTAPRREQERMPAQPPVSPSSATAQ